MGTEASQNATLANVPVGRRTPRGKRQWYLANAPKREQLTCDKLRKSVSPDLLEVAFVMRKELAKLSFPVSIAKGEGGHFVPMAIKAQQWYERMMDATHMIRTITAVFVDGERHIQDGPMMGREAHVTKIDWHRRFCDVVVDDGSGGFSESVPFAVPFKN